MAEEKLHHALIKMAEETLLKPEGITRADLNDTLSIMMRRHIDYADLYFQQYYA